MPLTMHQASVPALVQILGSLTALIDKAEAFCEARKVDPAVVLNYRLAADMFPFTRQIQIATDQAKGIAARLAGVEVPSYEDSEASFADLKARLAKTIEFVTSLPAARFEGAETREITIKLRTQEVHFTGAGYLFGFALPHFYFHATTAYDILRHIGVEVGKRDFIGAAPVR